jgi:hypothetical protein
VPITYGDNDAGVVSPLTARRCEGPGSPIDGATKASMKGHR